MLSLGAASLLAAPAYAVPSEVQAKKETKTVTFKTSIHCKNCVKKINDNLAFEKGVKDLRVSLDDKLVTVKYDPAKTDEATLAKALEKLGYKVERVEL